MVVMKTLFAKIILVLVLLSLFAGCIQQISPAQNLRLATTTSTCDTGLLDNLNKNFEKANSVKIITTCEGTGKAIAAGELEKQT